MNTDHSKKETSQKKKLFRYFKAHFEFSNYMLNKIKKQLIDNNLIFCLESRAATTTPRRNQNQRLRAVESQLKLKTKNFFHLYIHN